MKLSKEQAQDYAYGDLDPESDPYSVEANEYTGSGRWESHHLLVLKDKDGRYWSATYTQGLTESQDIGPFEWDGDEIEFTQVEKVPVITYEYREVKP